MRVYHIILFFTKKSPPLLTEGIFLLELLRSCFFVDVAVHLTDNRLFSNLS